MDRRQTLGQLSSNTRFSMAPARASKAGGPAAKGRQSMAPPSVPAAGAAARVGAGRSAGMSRRSGHGQRPSDPRPISSKEWQQDTMRALITFLSTRGYEHGIDLKVDIAHSQ